MPKVVPFYEWWSKMHKSVETPVEGRTRSVLAITYVSSCLAGLTSLGAWLVADAIEVAWATAALAAVLFGSGIVVESTLGRRRRTGTGHDRRPSRRPATERPAD
jgi:hypothetical protein